ncbi:MAG TPA: DUF5659 domain-containing protein [Gemmatimonadales bacterium]|jgi:hypothetical protein|nr:DUF5659 domain-containing protein [Gemmatimonadales bacterium]
MSEFMTSDLQLAAWLRLLGHEPTRIDGTARNRVFVFPSVPEWDVADYYKGTRAINAQRLFGHYRELRARLFEL